MQLFEFQAKELLSRYGVSVPEGVLAGVHEAEAAASRLGPGTIYVKAQTLIGARAAVGGVRGVQSAAQVKAAVREMLGHGLESVARDNQIAGKILIEREVPAERELYLALRVDAPWAAVVVTAGPGGTGVESRAAELRTLQLRSGGERRPGEIADFARGLGLPQASADGLRVLIEQLHRALLEQDALLIEINPLIVSKSGGLVAADAKIVLDDNAMFRHPEMAALGDQTQENQVELKAQRHQINYVQMDGDIGTVVNGAGLGLATLDMIRAAGGAPANFMDIRTTARSLDIAQGIGLVLDNSRVKVLLVNVFGGGMQPCDTIVEGLGIAFRRHTRRIPIVLRVTGNNEQLARLRLANFDLPKIECKDMWQAVTRAVSITQGRA